MNLPRIRRLVRRVLGLLALFAGLWVLVAEGSSAGAATGAITVAPGMPLYQSTENGLALQATIQGTKYFKNDELNGK